MPLDIEKKREIFAPFIKVLRATREAADLSQYRLATDSGFSRKYVTMIELGARVPSIEAMVVLCATAGVNRSVVENLLEELLELLDWKEEK